MKQYLILIFCLLAYPSNAGMNLNIDSLTVDGLEVRKLSCQLNDANLFSMTQIVAAMAKQKTAFDQCAASAGAFKIKWNWASGKIEAKVLTANPESATSCIESVAQKIQPNMTGSCEGFVLTGDSKKAAALIK